MSFSSPVLIGLQHDFFYHDYMSHWNCRNLNSSKKIVKNILVLLVTKTILIPISFCLDSLTMTMILNPLKIFETMFETNI